MKVYGFDNKQCESLSRFFIKNSKILIISVVLCIIALISWLYWHNYYKNAMTAASSNCQPVNTSLASQENQPQSDFIQHFADINNNNYGVLTFLELAQQYAEQDNFATAQTYLQKALNQTCEANLQSIINLRLARMQLQQNNIDGALNTLNSIREKGWMALVEDTRGDAQVLKGDHQAARIAYEKALQSGAPQMLQVLVRIKLNNLSS